MTGLSAWHARPPFGPLWRWDYELGVYWCWP